MKDILIKIVKVLRQFLKRNTKIYVELKKRKTIKAGGERKMEWSMLKYLDQAYQGVCIR